MQRTLITGLGAAILSGSVMAGALPAGAQTPASCEIVAYTDPPREVLRCRDGLSISAEAGAAYALTDRNRDGRPEAATLSGRGLLIEAPRRSRGAPSFQIQTPHAIASVRGTVWAVDVSASRTSVFVQEGAVAVSRAQGGAAVTLRAGDGVDVDAQGGALEVKRWAPARVANLLARFGR